MSASVQVPLSELVLDKTLWPRLQFDDERVALFMDLYEAGGPKALPPLLLVPDNDSKYLVADGWHRAYAAARLQWKAIEATIEPVPEGGDPERFGYELALKSSVAAAKPLSCAERRRAIARLLELSASRSDREIAALVGVAHTTVSRLRKALQQPERTEPGSDEPGQRYVSLLTAEDVARRIFRGIEKVWEARGLGIMDTLVGDRTAERLAGVLREAFGEEALDRAERYRTWIEGAIAKLKAESA